jgi:hypothetical protein
MRRDPVRVAIEQAGLALLIIVLSPVLLVLYLWELVTRRPSPRDLDLAGHDEEDDGAEAW